MTQTQPGQSQTGQTQTQTGRLQAVLRSPGLIAALLAILTILTLLGAEPSVGYVRDEGIYFEASRHYGAWVARAFDADSDADTPQGNDPAEARAKLRDRYFAINHEHPALMKIAAGVSAQLFAEPPDPAFVDALDRAAKAKPKPKSKANAGRRAFAREVAVVEGGRFPLLREGAAMRLPSMVLTGLAVALLFLAGRRYGGGNIAGLLAAGAFALLPRVAFHASLHAFDAPIAAMTLVLALAWLRALDDWRWALALGPLLGVAIAVKHNALFLGPLFALHLWLCLGLRWWRSGERPRPVQLAPLSLGSMALVGPLVAVALWPWLWHDTLARVAEYFAFHSEHSYYNMEFGGLNYNRPPLPLAYPFVMTWATVPSVLLLLAGIGGVAAGLRLRAPTEPSAQARAQVRAQSRAPGWLAPLPPLAATREDGPEGPLLFVGLALFPLALIALPSIPIFGGTKHWLTAYPFMALLAALGWGWLWSTATPWLRERAGDSPGRLRLLSAAPAVALVAVLTPSAWSTAHGHPFNLSQYAPLAGGARGAASAGLNRGFWGHSLVPLLGETALVPPGPVYLHDVHALAATQYRREGRWPGWTRSGVRQARAGLLFPELHMTRDEIELWSRFGTAPTMVLTLDDVPVTVVYSGE